VRYHGEAIAQAFRLTVLSRVDDMDKLVEKGSGCVFELCKPGFFERVSGAVLRLRDEAKGDMFCVKEEVA